MLNTIQSVFLSETHVFVSISRFFQKIGVFYNPKMAKKFKIHLQHWKTSIFEKDCILTQKHDLFSKRPIGPYSAYTFTYYWKKFIKNGWKMMKLEHFLSRKDLLNNPIYRYVPMKIAKIQMNVSRQEKRFRKNHFTQS
jgi:hypothetical protein